MQPGHGVSILQVPVPAVQTDIRRFKNLDYAKLSGTQAYLTEFVRVVKERTKILADFHGLNGIDQDDDISVVVSPGDILD